MLQEAPQSVRDQAAQANLILTEAQLRALEKAQQAKAAHGEIETAHPGYLGAQDTFYVGTLQGGGRIYQQTVIDTYTRVAHVKLSDRKNALVPADLLNDRVLPWFEEQEVRLLRILTDRGTEYCGSWEHHEYKLYRALEDIAHTKTKARHPPTNGICERFHRTMLEEFYQVAFRTTVYTTVEQLQADADEWVRQYNEARPPSGRYCDGRPPWQTFAESKPLAPAKMLDLWHEPRRVRDPADTQPLDDRQLAPVG